MPKDSEELRLRVAAFLPGFTITGVAKESGQRVVYCGNFRDQDVPDDFPRLRGMEAFGLVATKVATLENPHALAYLQREILVLSELHSPNFPRLLFYEVYSEDPVTNEPLPERVLVTVEEWVESQPLSNLQDEYRDEQRVLRLLVSLATALTKLWLHPSRLVHRDLKPENILIRPNGDVVVIDLGIVREAGTAGITATEAVHGPLSWPYCSPEQARNDKRAISFKSDFFSLGVIAYQLIAGFNPFNVSGQEHPARQREAILNLTPKPLVEVSGCHEPTSTLVMKMLEKQPYQRPRTPEILIEELHGALQ